MDMNIAGTLLRFAYQLSWILVILTLYNYAEYGYAFWLYRQRKQEAEAATAAQVATVRKEMVQE